MIGALVTVISLNMTLALVQAGQVAGSLPVTGATVATPIELESPGHGVPLGRVVHGVASGIFGTTEANGLWVLRPTDADHFALYSCSAQGILAPSVGANAYVSGGVIQYAFPDYQILLGRRNVALSTAVTSPRIVFVPTDGRAWGFEAYGGVGSPASLPNVRGSLEQQSEKTQPQLATEFTTFEVYVQGAANPPSPDFGDFDATQALVFELYSQLFDASGGARAKVLHESWPSQSKDSGTQTQRGQQWCGVVEFQQPVIKSALSFVPAGTKLTLTVIPTNPGSTDATVIVIT